MNFKDLSTTFHTTKVMECCDFYTKYFEAKVTFNCGWYITIKLGDNVFLSFMQPQEGDAEYTGGITLNLLVDDVDSEYSILKKAGINIFEEISDHEWGDRSFSVLDPLGSNLHIYSEREMSEEYKDAVK